MALVDDRGRLGGRVNLVDAIVAVAILVLIPIAYGAYLLFQTPHAKLVEVDPKMVYQGPNVRVAIKGKNLRPFMRVSFNTVQGRTFLIGSTQEAMIDLPDLAPGTYDVVLYDYAQEVDRLPKALTVLPLSPNPTVTMTVAGSFKGVSERVTAALKPGTRFPPTGEPLAEIVSVAAPVPAAIRLRAGDVPLGVPLPDHHDVPATLTVKCSVANTPDGVIRCLTAGPQQPTALGADALLTLAGPEGWVNFQIGEVHAAGAPTDVTTRVRFLATPEIVARMKIGDVDTSPKARAQSHGAVITGLGDTRAIPSAEAGPRAPVGPVRIIEATLRVPVETGVAGWSYKDQPVRSGESITFETALYIVRGEIADVVVPTATSGQAGKR